jgi:hypothetical protein
LEARGLANIFIERGLAVVALVRGRGRVKLSDVEREHAGGHAPKRKGVKSDGFSSITSNEGHNKELRWDEKRCIAD